MAVKKYFPHKELFLYRIHWEILGCILGYKNPSCHIVSDDTNKLPKSRMIDLIAGSYTWQGFRNGLIFMQRVEDARASRASSSNKSSNFKNGFDRKTKLDNYDSDLESDFEKEIIGTDNGNLLTEFDSKLTTRANVGKQKQETVKAILVDDKQCYDDVNPDHLIEPPSRWRLHYWKLTVVLNLFVALTILMVKLQSHFQDDSINTVPLDCHLPKYVVLATKHPNIIQMVAVVAASTVAAARLLILSKSRYELDYAIFMIASVEQIIENMDPEKAKLRYKKIGNLNAIQQCLFYRYLSPGNRIEFRLKPNRSLECKQRGAKRLSLLMFLTNLIARPGFFVFPLTLYSTLFLFDSFYRGCQIDLYGPLRWYYKGISLLLTIFINFEWDELVADLTVLTISLIEDLQIQRDDLESRLTIVSKAIDQQLDDYESKENQSLHHHGEFSNQSTRYNMDGPMGKYSNFLISNSSVNHSPISTTSSFFASTRPKSPLHYDIDHHYPLSNMNRGNLYRARGYQHSSGDRLNMAYISSASHLKNDTHSKTNQLSIHTGQTATLYQLTSRSIDDSELLETQTKNKSFDNHSITISSQSAPTSPSISPREEIADFQSRTLDYFQSLNRADELVSTTFGIMYFFLIMANVTMVMIESSRGWIRGWTYIKLLQALGLPISYSFMFYVNNLNRVNLRLYQQICSFMARDTSISKLRWIGLLRYYNDKPGYSFTVFRVEIMSNGLLLKFASTVLSLTSFMASADFLAGSNPV